MGRTAPEKTVEHRVTLGGTERRLLESYVESRWVGAVDGLIKGAAVMTLGVAAGAGVWVLANHWEVKSDEIKTFLNIPNPQEGESFGSAWLRQLRPDNYVQLAGKNIKGETFGGMWALRKLFGF